MPSTNNNLLFYYEYILLQRLFSNIVSILGVNRWYNTHFEARGIFNYLKDYYLLDYTHNTIII